VKEKNFILSLSISFLSLFSIANAVYADLISDEAKLGANAGAMNYCRDNFMTDDDKGLYNILALKTLEDFNRLSSGDKVKALVYKKAAEDGEYLGEPLGQIRCVELRQLLYIQYGEPSVSN
jgi:hypothetical protein